MRIRDRVDLYKRLYKRSAALIAVKETVDRGFYTKSSFDALEAIRELNTRLSELYMVSLPVLTVWVRDNNYVAATQEIYLREPELEGFLHCFRHHLQNIERRYERRGLTAEGLDKEYWKIPYTDCVYRMYGEDDAEAWSKFLIELAGK